jgi:hypothetical protein
MRPRPHSGPSEETNALIAVARSTRLIVAARAAQAPAVNINLTIVADPSSAFFMEENIG